ncbi:MAG: glycosyltransferase family 39 protein [Anaerolineales bacterium]|nr:glycosyltransferase family 39 protein [Anaerolineales bacterium]
MRSQVAVPPAVREPAARAPWPQRYGLRLLLAAFGLLGSLYAIVTPLFEVSDEVWHYPMVRTLAEGHGLPVQNPAQPGPWRQEGSQPPLYYAVMALATAWIDTGDMPVVRWVNPHADNGIITADRNNNIIIHTDRERWPWHGTVLAVRLIRLLSVLLGAGTVYFTYRLAAQVLPGRSGLALAAAAFTAFTPMFVFISASVNNDNLAITLSAAALWLAARWVRGPAATSRELVLMGLILGGAALSKTSALGLWPLAGAALVFGDLKGAGWLARPAGAPSPALRGLWPTARRLAVVFGLALLTSGWWFWRNYQLYGDWLGWNAFLATVGQRPHPAGLLQLWGERVGFVQAYWGLFGGVSVAMPGWVYAALNLAAAAAGAGLLWAAGAALARGRIDLTSLALWGLVLGWLALIVAGLGRWTSLTWASQGRLAFPAISAIGVLLAAGLNRLWRGLPWLIVAGMGLLTGAVPFAIIAPHYAPPPALSAAEQAAIPNKLAGGAGVSFGGELRLLGYALETGAARPNEALRLTLYWQSEIALDRNWSIFVHVVDVAGVIVAQRDRYPGQGSLATTLLTPGQTWADAYVIPIPDAAFAPAAAHIEVGLFDLVDGVRLPLADGTDALVLTPVTILARPAVALPGLGEIPNPFGQNFANQIELLGYDMDRRALRPGETLRLALDWRALGPIPANYSVFAHVRGEGESLWAGQDSWPLRGSAPTSTWRLGDVYRDPYELTLQSNTPPGLYDVEVGLYDADGARLRVIADNGRVTDADFVFLSRIRVLP